MLLQFISVVWACLGGNSPAYGGVSTLTRYVRVRGKNSDKTKAMTESLQSIYHVKHKWSRTKDNSTLAADVTTSRKGFSANGELLSLEE